MVEPELAIQGTEAQPIQTDVVIIGGGLAGASAAIALFRQGYGVTLISSHERHPPDFRAEKVAQTQMELFERIGLGDVVRAEVTAFDGVWLHRFGRFERTTTPEYGGDYSDLVNTVRRAIPAGVHSIVGRVDDITTSENLQHVTLSDGRKFTARLLIVATGLGDTIRKKLGIERDIISPQHSLCCGFDLVQPRSHFPFPSLVWNGAKFNDRVSYLTLFPIGDKIRANFFVYRTSSEEWTRTFRDQPAQGLRTVMPGLERVFGEITIAGPVIARPIDLVQVHNHEQDGVVLIGDAFCVVCPITGTGIEKALTDVDRLCNIYIPRWFKSAGMSKAKIHEFYADPIKTARDASAMKMSFDAKKIKTDLGMRWKLRRLRSNTLGRARYVVRATVKQLRSPAPK